jgi:hypothetical protein
MKKFSETQPANEKETDRNQLKSGDKFTLTGFIIQPSIKYPDGISKINGLDMRSGQIVKFWTTGQAIKTQLKNIEVSCGLTVNGDLKERVGVLVIEKTSEKGRTYLSFADPV